ncbi:hypothetical protein Tco_1182416 [Tanacetum coccineum]
MTADADYLPRIVVLRAVNITRLWSFSTAPLPSFVTVGFSVTFPWPVSHYYDLDDNVYPTFLTATREEIDLFAFIRHADPTKVRIGERQIEEGQVPLLDSTQGRVIPLANKDDHGDQNENTESLESLNEGGGGAAQESHSKFQVAAADKPKGTRKKRKASGGASGSNLSPKKLREDHGTSGDAGASTAGKSLAAL